MLNARDADMERSPTRKCGSTSHVDWSISNALTTSTEPTIDLLESHGGVHAGNQGGKRSRNLEGLQRSSGVRSPSLWRTMQPEKAPHDVRSWCPREQ